MVFFTLSIIVAFIVYIRKRYFPTNKEKQKKNADLRKHEKELFNQFSKNTEHDEQSKYYGEFVLHDAAIPLPEDGSDFEEISKIGYSIENLGTINDKSVGFLLNLERGAVFIKNVAGHWVHSERDDSDSIEVVVIGVLPYGAICFVDWTDGGFWETPRIACSSEKPKKIPYSKKYYATQKEFRGKYLYNEICETTEVSDPIKI